MYGGLLVYNVHCSLVSSTWPNCVVLTVLFWPVLSTGVHCTLYNLAGSSWYLPDGAAGSSVYCCPVLSTSVQCTIWRAVPARSYSSRAPHCTVWPVLSTSVHFTVQSDGRYLHDYGGINGAAQGGEFDLHRRRASVEYITSSRRTVRLGSVLGLYERYPNKK